MPGPRRRWGSKPLLPIAVRTSLLGAFAALAYDFSHGSFLISMLACPPWFLVSVIRSAWLRPGWPVAFVRAVIPLAVLAAVLANDAHQRRLAKANAEKIVNAIRSFRDGSGRYPTDLQELVPGQLDSVPRPKHAVIFNTFYYVRGGSDSAPSLWWIDVAPYGKRFYNFDKARWSFID